MQEGSQRVCGKINNIAEDILVLWYSCKFLPPGESLKQSEIQYDSLEMLLSERAPSNRNQKTQRHLKKVTDAFDTCVCFHTTSQSRDYCWGSLSKALQVLELEGMETKRKGKTAHVLWAELNPGRLNWSENILSIN